MNFTQAMESLLLEIEEAMLNNFLSFVHIFLYLFLNYKSTILTGLITLDRARHNLFLAFWVDFEFLLKFKPHRPQCHHWCYQLLFQAFLPHLPRYNKCAVGNRSRGGLVSLGVDGNQTSELNKQIVLFTVKLSLHLVTSVHPIQYVNTQYL